MSRQRRRGRATRPKTASACSKSCCTSAFPSARSGPTRCRAQTIEHILAAAQRTASWCNSQPWQVADRKRRGQGKFRKLIYAEAASGADDGHDFPPPREYRGVYLERRRESGFQLYNTLGIPRGDKAAYARQALENFNFFGAPHVAIVHTDEPLGVYGAIDCGGLCRQFHAGGPGAGPRHDCRRPRWRSIPA